MGSHNHADLVLLKELVDDVRPVHHDVVVALWVADRVLLHAKNFIRQCRITPHDIHAHLLYLISDAAKLDAERPLNLVDVLKLHNRVTDSSVDAQDTILGHFVGNDGT